MAEPERRRRRLRHTRPRAAEPPPAPATEPTVPAEPPRPPEPPALAEPPVLAEPTRPPEATRPPAAAEPTRPSAATGAPAPRTAGSPARDRDAERGLRGLVGSGASQVGTSAALRARDAARPTDEDIAAAERDVVIVRRNWVPREDLPRRH